MKNKMLKAKGYKAFRGTMRILWSGKPMEEIYGDWICTPNGSWYCGEYAYPKELCEIVEVGGHWEDGCAIHNGKEVYKSIDCSVCHGIFKIESHDPEYWKKRFKACPFCGTKMDGDGNAKM